MIYPPISSLLEKVDSRYTLVVAVAKRARQLAEGSKILTGHKSERFVTLAVNEIEEGKVSYTRTKNGIK
ncbi:MAG: DNA-directed RNA polymerase subunit omega [Acetivibrionales bacterium]|jgi:DNA-directed RNA polymerase subunit omega